MSKTPEELAAEAEAQAEAAAAESVTEPEAGTEGAEPGGDGGETNNDEAFLDMSDEDFEKQMTAGGLPPEPETKEGDGEETPKAEEAAGEVKPEETPAAETPVKPEETPAEGDKPKVEETQEAKTEAKPETKTSPLDADDSTAAEHYREIMKPFKANGKEVQVRSKEEAIRLMQMGAGHVKYQQQVRPMLAQAQTLKNNGIDADTLNYLIELNNGNKDAIKKLVRDAGLDPYEIETDDESKAADKAFRPKDYSASEEQVTLDDLVTSIRSTEAGSELLEDVRTNWDQGSRQMLLEDPGILSVISGQKQSGVYDQITAEINRRQTLGDLTNVSFLKAYHQIGTEMENNGAFTQTTSNAGCGSTENKTEAEPKRSEVVAKQAAKPKAPNTNDGAAAVAPVKKATPAKPFQGNVLDMSDEEFAKMEKQFA